MRNRRQRRRGFRLGWVNRQRFLWGAIGFVLGIATMFVWDNAGGGFASALSNLGAGVGGECRNEHQDVVRLLRDANGNDWTVRNASVEGIGGMNLTVCAVSSKAVVIQGPADRLTDVDTGLTVFVTLYNDVYVMRNHTWH